MGEPALDQGSYNYCALPLAVYASRPDKSLGRIYPSAESKFRTCFQRDRDRIIHCSAFRRLKYKTQVFIYHTGDHYRTRLTHTLEVAQVARTLARALMVNEDLAETVALAHDLGHAPFAHLGEDVLKECMKDVGGFDHNDQSLRVLTVLERKYPDWPGLNLTWETLEGVVKHNGPVDDTDLPITAKMLQGQTDLRLETYASIEAQCAALADDIAYNNHDVEDGVHAGLFTLTDIRDVKLMAGIMDSIRQQYPDISNDLMICAVIREMIGAMVVDVLTETRRRLEALNPQTPEDIRTAGRAMVDFSEPMLEQVNELRHFLRTRMYQHDKVVSTRKESSKIVEALYHAFVEGNKEMPEEWQEYMKNAEGKVARARVVADYIAGMTDRYAMREHERLFS